MQEMINNFNYYVMLSAKIELLNILENNKYKESRFLRSDIISDQEDMLYDTTSDRKKLKNVEKEVQVLSAEIELNKLTMENLSKTIKQELNRLNDKQADTIKKVFKSELDKLVQQLVELNKQDESVETYEQMRNLRNKIRHHIKAGDYFHIYYVHEDEIFDALTQGTLER